MSEPGGLSGQAGSPQGRKGKVRFNKVFTVPKPVLLLGALIGWVLIYPLSVITKGKFYIKVHREENETRNEL